MLKLNFGNYGKRWPSLTMNSGPTVTDIQSLLTDGVSASPGESENVFGLPILVSCSNSSDHYGC